MPQVARDSKLLDFVSQSHISHMICQYPAKTFHFITLKYKLFCIHRWFGLSSHLA